MINFVFSGFEEIETSEEFGYVYLSDIGFGLNNATSVAFGIRAHNDAHFTLAEVKHVYRHNAYHVVIGESIRISN